MQDLIVKYPVLAIYNNWCVAEKLIVALTGIFIKQIWFVEKILALIT